MNNKENTAVLEMLEEIKAQLSDINHSKEIPSSQTQVIDLSGIEAQMNDIRNCMKDVDRNISDRIDKIEIKPDNDGLNQKIDYLTGLAGQLPKKLPPQNHNHWHFVSLKSPFILAYVIFFILLLSSLILNCHLNRQNNLKADNDLKYRYIKMINRKNEFIGELEKTFKYERDNDKINNIRKQVKDYENALERDAERFYFEEIYGKENK